MSNDAALSWSTPPSAVLALCGGGLALFATSFVVATEPAGEVLVRLAGVLLVVIGAAYARQRPRLAVLPGDAGIESQRLTARHVYTRDQIERVRIVRYPRLGRRVPMLEIDVRDRGIERLLIFGRWDLGATPQSVFDALAVHGLVPPDRERT